MDGARPLLVVQREGDWFPVAAADISLLDVLADGGHPPRLAKQPFVGERRPAVPLRP